METGYLSKHLYVSISSNTQNEAAAEQKATWWVSVCFIMVAFLYFTDPGFDLNMSLGQVQSRISADPECDFSPTAVTTRHKGPRLNLLQEVKPRLQLLSASPSICWLNFILGLFLLFSWHCSVNFYSVM